MNTLKELGDKWEREALAGVMAKRDRIARSAALCKEGGEYGAQMLRTVAMYDRMIAAASAQPVSAGLTDEQTIFDWLQRKYVQRADSRQKMLGLVYTEAETHDLAEGLAKLFSSLLSAAQRDSQPVAGTSADARDAALAEVHAFLLGEGPLDGLWYGDVKPDAPTKRYWWRTPLRAAIAASREGK